MTESSEAAKTAYRAAWLAYQQATNADQRIRLGDEMDRLQSQICRGPGSEWDAFKATLPGFEDFWADWFNDALKIRNRSAP